MVDLCNVDPFEGDCRSKSKIILARIEWIGRYCIADFAQPYKAIIVEVIDLNSDN